VDSLTQIRLTRELIDVDSTTGREGEAGEFIARTVPGAEPFGAVAVGQRADLLLLQANPLASLAALTTPSGVMLRGRWWNAEALKAKLEAIVH